MNIILSPHFDDAVLSLGGLLAQKNDDAVVATFFAGAPERPMTTKWDTVCGFSDSTQAIRERTVEDRNALASFGVPSERIRIYDHLDAQYRTPDRTKNDPYIREPELEASIANEIVSLVHEFHAGGPITIYSPGVETRAHDHHIVKDAALAAMHELPDGSASLFFYQDTPHVLGIMDRIYPRTIWNRLARKDEMHWDYSLLEQEIARGRPVSRAIIPLSNADMEKKLAGIALYASQVDPLSKNLSGRIKRFSAGEAKFFSLNAPYCEVTYKLELR